MFKKTIVFASLVFSVILFNGCGATSGEDGNVGNGYADEYKHDVKLRSNEVLSVNLITNAQSIVSLKEYYYDKENESNSTTTTQEDTQEVPSLYYIVKHPSDGTIFVDKDTVSYFPNSKFKGIDEFALTKGTVRDEIFIKYSFIITVK